MQVIETGRLPDGKYYLNVIEKSTGRKQYANAYHSVTTRDTAIISWLYGRLPGTGYTTRVDENVAGLTQAVHTDWR